MKDQQSAVVRARFGHILRTPLGWLLVNLQLPTVRDQWRAIWTPGGSCSAVDPGIRIVADLFEAIIDLPSDLVNSDGARS